MTTSDENFDPYSGQMGEYVSKHISYFRYWMTETVVQHNLFTIIFILWKYHIICIDILLNWKICRLASDRVFDGIWDSVLVTPAAKRLQQWNY